MTPEAQTPPPRKRAAKAAAKTAARTPAPVDAATIEEVITQAKMLGEQAVDFQETWVASVAHENVIFKRRNRVLTWMVAGVLALTLFSQGRSLFQTQPLLNRVKTAVTGIEKNQEGIDSLVAFVADVQAQQCTPTPGHACPQSQTEQLVGTLTSLLCSSTDPVRVEACHRLHLEPVKAP